MASITCPNCSTPAPAGAIFCDNCGFDLRGAVAAPPPVSPAPAWAPQAPSGGVTCPICQHPNLAGAGFCENCGSQLAQVQAPAPMAPQQPAYPPPQQPADQPPPPVYQPEPTPVYPPPVQTPFQPPFAGTVTGRLVIQESNTNLPIPPGKQEILLGREDPVSNIFPEINLDPVGGQEGGVSRRHARISIQNGVIMLEDLNTVNGTTLNRQKLTPGTPMPLNNGDELRLGKLVIHYFSA
jgi:hypothetical protein